MAIYAVDGVKYPAVIDMKIDSGRKYLITFEGYYYFNYSYHNKVVVLATRIFPLNEGINEVAIEASDISIGSKCRARYPFDGKFYDCVIKNIEDDKITVNYPGYNEDCIVKVEDLRYI